MTRESADRPIIHRRRFLLGTAALIGAGTPALAQAGKARGACAAGAPLTVGQTEGPYFTANTPKKADFTPDDPRGKPMILSGRVLTRDCRPVRGAKIDLWHADSGGAYDNDGFRLRGHVFTDADGRFSFRTVEPGIYPGRTRHFHAKVTPPGGSTLTTQLYFPGESANARDFIFDRRLMLRVVGSEKARTVRFDFVVAA